MQTASQQHQACRYLSYLEAMIGAADIFLETSSDFRAYQAVREQLAVDGGLDLPYRRLFSPAFVDLAPATGLWVCGRDGKGELAHVSAMRLDDLRGVTLGQWWEQHFHRLFCDSAEGRWASTAPIVATITGRVCYHGEVWIAPAHRQKNIGGQLGQWALTLALLTWSPDYVYGLIQPRLVKRGFGVMEGYMHQQPRALTWETCPEGVDPEDWIGWMTRDDLIYLTQQGANRTVRMPSGN